MKWHKLIVLGLALLAAGCTKTPSADTPEGALHSYVTTAFNARSASDRQKLLALSTGDAKAFLEKMTDAEFQHQFIDSKLRFVSLSAKDKRQEIDGDVSLVYELNYKDASAPAATVYMNKKIAYLTREGGGWKIRATKNVKSFIERKDDLLITPESTGQETPAEKK